MAYKSLSLTGAAGDGATDDTAALAAWIGQINAAQPPIALLPPGQFLVSYPLPPITASAVIIAGVGWAQQASTRGSSIFAGSSFAGDLLTIEGEGVELRGLTVDGRNHVPTLIAVTGGHFRFIDSQARAVASGGVCIDIRSGGSAAWIDKCVISGLNGANTGIQVNDTDIIISGTKPQNNAYNVVLLNGASGALISGNHMTPGGPNGVNCIWLKGQPSHVLIDANRFDNYPASAIQISPGTGIPADIKISGNQFHSTVLADDKWALIGVDTSQNGVHGLHVSGNSGYARSSARPAHALAAQTAAGTAAGMASRLAKLGTLFSANSFWLAGSFFAPSSSPTVARGNIVTVDGSTYSVVPDV
jgi:hypothetical protein